MTDELRPSELHREFTVAGLRVAVFESGAGEPCVLLHGYPQNHRCWRRVAPALAATHRVIAVDWFGWGKSERSLDAAPRFDDEVGRLARLLDALELSRTNLFGHDYGGFLALGLAVRHPERILRLALSNTRAHSTFAPASYVMFGAMSLIARTPILRGLFEWLPLDFLHRALMRRYVSNGSFSNSDLEDYVGWLAASEGRRWLAHFYRHYEVKRRSDLREKCRSLTVPASIIWGDTDPYLPFSIAEELAALVPSARLVRIRGGSHYVVEERPDEVTAALQALLSIPASTEPHRSA